MRPFASFVFLASLSLQAQQYTAAKIHFDQPGPFAQQQLEAVAGLHTGSSFTTAELTAAAQRLMNTGYFENVGATVDGKITAVTVNFDIKPLDRAALLPVGFANIVWLTRDEIEAAITSKLPLFIDALPENSPSQDDIKAALIAALDAKSITADVAYDTFEPTLRHPTREIGFRIVKPSIRVANIKLTGVTPDLVPLVQKSVNTTARTLYSEGPADQTTADLILAPLQDSGYAQAKLTGVALAPGTIENGTAGVVLSGKLEAGEIFHVSSLAYTATPLLSVAAFGATAKLHPGDIASRKALLETLTPLDAAYRRKGYMDVVIDAHPTPDPATKQIAYTVTVTPGETYRVHEVTTNNLDPAAKADFDRGFLMKTGELYNPEYLALFLKNNTALRALEGYSASFKAYADPNTHTVDVVITFVRAGR